MKFMDIPKNNSYYVYYICKNGDIYFRFAKDSYGVLLEYDNVVGIWVETENDQIYSSIGRPYVPGHILYDYQLVTTEEKFKEFVWIKLKAKRFS